MQDFPTDEDALDRVEQALDDHRLDDLMDELSGYDAAKTRLIGRLMDVPTYVVQIPLYSREDIIRALINELRETRRFLEVVTACSE